MTNRIREKIVARVLARAIRPETLAAVCKDLLVADDNDALSDRQAADAGLLLQMLMDRPEAQTDEFKLACFGTTEV
jgi:hypothetical protein